MVGVLALKTALLLGDGGDVPPQRLGLSFLGSARDELVSLGYSYVGPSAVTPSAFYGAALNTFGRLRVLPTSLGAGAVPLMLLVEVEVPLKDCLR